MSTIKVLIAGASGITGIELIKILDNHDNCEIISVLSRTYAGEKISSKFKNTLSLKNNKDLFFKDTFSDSDIKQSDVVFLCLPSGKSMEFVKTLSEKKYKGKIIDLGSDFRLKDSDIYKEWYGISHIMKNMLPKFVYGLCELNRHKIKMADYVANPGCYPTSILLALAPILENDNVRISSITIDAKSGVSGAGRKLEEDYLFLNISDNFFAYSPIKHRHIPEIEQELKNISGKETNISFTPHLLPINRGIFSTIYLKLDGNEDKKGLVNIINGYFEDYYKGEIFVDFIGENVPQIKDVAGTNSAQIGFLFDERVSVIKVFSVIDNILKGASGQAVQNMNIMFGYEEDLGLKMQGIFD